MSQYVIRDVITFCDIYLWTMISS